MNYKSLECYQRFTAGWVREILVAPKGEKRLVMAKVTDQCLCLRLHVLYFILPLGQSFPKDEGKAFTAIGNC